ncbi:MAG: hypothetical protein JNK48_19225 [Bryobacterales bacterium]|nr:hypothetical protein [Bryobacterales bacterium]
MGWILMTMLLGGWLSAGQDPPAAAPAPAAPAKPKTISKEYVLTVRLVKAEGGESVEEASVRVSYGGQTQTKPSTTGRVTFRFKTDAAEAVVRVNAPGMVIYNKAVPLKQEKLELKAELDPSD